MRRRVVWMGSVTEVSGLELEDCGTVRDREGRSNGRSYGSSRDACDQVDVESSGASGSSVECGVGGSEYRDRRFGESKQRRDAMEGSEVANEEGGKLGFWYAREVRNQSQRLCSFMLLTRAGASERTLRIDVSDGIYGFDNPMYAGFAHEFGGIRGISGGRRQIRVIFLIIISHWIFKIKHVKREKCNNLLGSSYLFHNMTERVPCLEAIPCVRYQWSLNINCGGDQVTTDDNLIYESDNDGSDGVSTFRVGTNWAVSSTGAFLDSGDNNNFITTTRKKISMPDSELYANARVSPLSLSYYGLCLLNGNYSVKLHFAEIIITDYNGYSSPGRRIFDVYIQGKLVLKDFNIKVEANGSDKAVVKKFNAIVTKNKLEIRFYWAGKGTTNIPTSGTYGPLVSAISVAPNFKPPRKSRKHVILVVGILVSVLCLIILLLYAIWKKGYFRRRDSIHQDLRWLELQTGSFRLRQIQDATNNFSASNKIGEGGFGPVYRGLLSDGTMIAVKQLSSKSTQGNREFLNEIGLISALQHPNLVRLYGCCVEENQLLLVYEYLENNSLANALFGEDQSMSSFVNDCLGPEKYQLKLDWLTRQKICVGIARGLAYLHEESMLRIVHRDIKPSNVLLDRELNPKISDFGLAKLNENEHTHISTRVAGTMGYMAPEYATRGYLTLKADVYSFGIVALEIVTGKSVTSITNEGNIHLLDWAHFLREKGELLMLVDKNLGLDFNKEEALRMIKVALLCSNSSPARRPLMSTVVSMLTSDISVPDCAPYSAQEIMCNPHDCKSSASENAILHFNGEVIDDDSYPGTSNSDPSRSLQASGKRTKLNYSIETDALTEQ
ncbi:hypothetical protein M5K25_023952 [Dendrobium thyrsiflorum]|uniref:non-specific serine/threonine protein kinase n=1 Tax=Dendrobium thyrsiflorum TaxID=117978 RepID=A0ABD0U0P5_DENTH